MKVLSRVRTRWSRDLQFRLTTGLSALIILLMLAVALFTISRQNNMLRQAAEARALAFSRTFASIGAAAVLENLFRIQESMEHYLHDPTIINIDVVDEDALIVSSRDAGRIGLELTDSSWQAVTASKQEAIVTIEGPDGEPALLLANPLVDQGEILAWVRIEISLAQMQQDQRQVAWKMGFLTLALVALLVGALRLALRKFSQVLASVHGPLAQALTLLGGEQLRHADLVGDDVGPTSERTGGTLEDMVAVVSKTTTLLMTQSESIRELMTSLERKVEERTAKLKTVQARFQAVVEHAAEGIITCDEYGSIQAFNPAASHIFGYPPEEVLEQNVNMLMPSPDHEQHDTFLTRYRQTEEGKAVGTAPEVVGRRKDGTTFPMDLLLSEMMVDGQRMFTGLFRDITDRKQMEAALAKARDAALESARLKSEFLTTMSHELRTPLNGILGYAQILKRDPNLTDKQKSGLEVIQHSGDHLLTLINDILDLSKIEAQRLELQVNEFHLPEFLKQIGNIIQVRAVQSGLSFVYQPVSALPTGVRGDEKRLRQILLNLLGNAVKFTETGGIVLKVGYDDSAFSPNLLRFQVEDTGCGISPDNFEKIFNPFQQVDIPKRHIESTGLGLAITKKLVDLMGGRLGVSSTPGKGSTFWFTVDLPIVEDGWRPVRPPDRKIIGYRRDRKRILVVDDKPENRGVIVNLLVPLGFDVQEAVNGQEGLAKATEYSPHLILMDLIMPVMDGIEATRRVRQSPDLQDIVVIASSASAFEFNRQDSLAAGCNDFLPKPVLADDLFEKLRTHLGLEWVYEGKPLPEEPPQVGAAMLVAPPKDTILTLADLAAKGKITDIRQQIAQIEQLSDEFHPFAAELDRLSKTFDMDQLTSFLNLYLEEKE